MKHSMLRSLRGAAVSIALLSVIATAADAASPGGFAPDFNFTLGSDAYSLSALRGRIVVLDFWSSWCGPCRQSLPEISRLNNEYSDVVFLGVNDESTDAIRSIEAGLRLSFPSILDSTGGIGELFGIRSIPTTIVIDRFGRIADIIVGFRSDGALERAIERARRL